MQRNTFLEILGPLLKVLSFQNKMKFKNLENPYFETYFKLKYDKSSTERVSSAPIKQKKLIHWIRVHLSGDEST